MTWLAPKLKYRVQIRKPVETPNSDGGFTRSYETLTTVWAGMKIKQMYGMSSELVEQIRSINSDPVGGITVFMMRYESIKNLGREFSTAFSSAFDSVANLEPVTAEMYLFMELGSTSKGRTYRVLSVKRDDDRKEWIQINTVNVEESGTGAAA